MWMATAPKRSGFPPPSRTRASCAGLVGWVGYHAVMQEMTEERLDGPVVLPFGVSWVQHIDAYGVLVAVALPEYPEPVPEYAYASLRPAEREFARTLKPRRALAWVGGRVALREAAGQLGAEAELDAVLSTPRGAPALPSTFSGSISHKDGLAIALLARSDGWFRGIDLETSEPARNRIARLVLTPTEKVQNEALAVQERWPDLLRHFVLKEALYKALDPMVGRYIGFREVRVDVARDGAAAFTLSLEPPAGEFTIEGRCWAHDPWLLSVVRARRAS